MTEVGARHILKKHRGSRRPSSWRVENITQTKEEAIAQIQQIRAILMEEQEKNGAQSMYELFATIASRESDCGSAQRGGDLPLVLASAGDWQTLAVTRSQLKVPCLFHMCQLTLTLILFKN